MEKHYKSLIFPFTSTKENSSKKKQKRKMKFIKKNSIVIDNIIKKLNVQIDLSFRQKLTNPEIKINVDQLSKTNFKIIKMALSNCRYKSVKLYGNNSDYY